MANLVPSLFASVSSAEEPAGKQTDAAVSRKKLQDGSESVTTPYGEYIITDPLRDAEAAQSDAGIGVRVTKGQKGLVIADVFPGSPAEKGGLKKADVIQAIDLGSGSMGETRHMSLEAAIKSLRGKSGTAVTLRVSSPRAKKPFKVTVIRSASAFSGAKSEHSTWREVPLKETGEKVCPDRWKDCYLIDSDKVTCNYSCPAK